MTNWQTLSSKIILKARHFQVRENKVKLPDGRIIDWPYWDSFDSVMIIALTSDKKIVMIKQYRYLYGKECLEFPSGGLLKNENILEGAKREFEEETGYKASNLIKLGSFYETISQLNRQIHIFFTKDIQKSEQNLDEGRRGFEEIKVKLIDYDQVLNLALSNKFPSMNCTLAILLLNEKIKRGEIKIK